MHPAGVAIKGFRSIDDLQLPLDRLTVLFGANGAGKTNLLDAVARLKLQSESLGEQDTEIAVGSCSVDLFLQTSPSGVEDRSWLLKVLQSSVLDVIPQAVLELLGPDFSAPAVERVVDGVVVTLPDSDNLAVVLESLASQLCGNAGDKDLNVALDFTRALLAAPLVAVAQNSTRIELAVRRGDPELRHTAEAVCSQLPPHLWVTQSASRCLSDDLEFVTLFPLGWLGPAKRKVSVDVLVLDSRPAGLEAEVEAALPQIFDRFWGASDAEEHDAAQELAWASAPDDPWLERIGDGVQVRRAIAPVLDIVARYAWSNAPGFVTDEGEIILTVTPIQQWWSTGRRVSVSFLFEHSGREFPLAALSAGLRRWVSASVREACRQMGAASINVWPSGETTFDPSDADGKLQLLSELLDGDEPLSQFRRLNYEADLAPPAGLVIVDEPELHLHPRAQEDVARWLLERSQQSLAVLAASHSSAFLTYEPAQATIIRVHRDGDRTITDVLDHDLVGALDQLDAEVGLGRAGLLQLVRGVLVVEGPHDELVIKHFYRTELAGQRLLVIPIHGASNMLAIAEGELFTRLGTPIRVIHDQGDREEKLARLLDVRSRQGADVKEISYDEPDVICALPEAAVLRAFPQATFRGWDQLKRAHGGKFGFKGHALAAMGLKGINPTKFVTDVLRVADSDERPSTAFHRAVHEAMSSIDAHTVPPDAK